MARFTSVLVANRGEIAARIIRSARDLGLRTVAVHTDADAAAPHVALADDAVRIGAGPVADSYLSIPAILRAARDSGAQAIHPGYGFLSENADFARAVTDAGLVFIGPDAAAIAAMGDKAAAKRAMIAAGVPCVPGYQGADQSDAALMSAAADIGLPLMVKAAAGGGGRGMRLVSDMAALPEALTRARAEAQSAFGDATLILERALTRARHVELQIIADSHGAVIHLGERDCSVQRRHQKVIEEAPAPGMTPALRDAMGRAAVDAARAVGYQGAGTVEFLLDAGGAFYFLEMNTRLQVEHPVTEAVTGLDLVALQFAVAQGAPLPLGQADLALDGHAIEARLYAEDPARGFLPVTGRVACFDPARGPGLRIDAGIATGLEVPPFYDPMLAKIIAHGPTREAARLRLLAALEQTAVLGLTTNAAFLGDILRHPEFAKGGVDTGFLAEHLPAPSQTPAPEAASPAPEAPSAALPVTGDADSRAAALAAALLCQHDAEAARDAAGLSDDSLLGFASDGGLPVPVDLRIAGSVLTLQARATGPGAWAVQMGALTHAITLARDPADPRGPWWRATCDGRRLRLAFAPDGDGGGFVQLAGVHHAVARHRPWAEAAAGAGADRIAAPMPGLVVSVTAQPGDRVTRGQTLAVLEAMKMQHPLCAPRDGVVAEIAVTEGQQIATGALIIRLEDSA